MSKSAWHRRQKITLAEKGAKAVPSQGRRPRYLAAKVKPFSLNNRTQASTTWGS